MKTTFAALLLLAATAPLLAQQTPAPSGGATTAAGAVAPEQDNAVKGLNFTLTTSSQYDQLSAWSSSLTPDLSYTFDKHLNFDFSIPYYNYLTATVSTGSPINPAEKQVVVHNLWGDATINGTVSFAPGSFTYSFTGTGGLPVGNTQYDLSSTQYTYTLMNNVGYNVGIFSPYIEFGEGDSSNLGPHHAVVKSLITVGPLAFFTAGTGVNLPHDISFTVDGYEQLPLENMNSFKTVKNLKKQLVTEQTGSGPAEDNGIETDLSIPVQRHLALGVTFSHSLRQNDNTVGFSLTYTLRTPKPVPPAPASAASPAK